MNRLSEIPSERVDGRRLRSERTRQLIIVTQDKIIGVDPASGALFWERAFPSKISVNSGTPVMAGDTQLTFGTPPTVLPQANGGRLRAIAGVRFESATFCTKILMNSPK